LGHFRAIGDHQRHLLAPGHAFLITGSRLPYSDFAVVRCSILTSASVMVIGSICRRSGWRPCGFFFRQETSPHIANLSFDPTHRPSVGRE
jgi:hypothetical protein